MNAEHSCQTCVFWKHRGAQIATAARDPSSPDNSGTCHAYPPVLMMVPGEPWPVTLWPRTHEDACCAEYATPDDEPDDPAREPIPEEQVVVPFRSAA